MRTPKTKSEFYQRYLEGEFGNIPKTWSWDDLDKAKSEFNGLVVLRNKIPGGPCYYNVPLQEINKSDFENISNISESLDDSYLIFQGNVRKGFLIELEYSTLKEKFRPALAKEFKTAQGTIAIEMMRHWMDQKSFEWTMFLINEYEDSVVEFSTYGKEVGIIPGMNTVYWEVRGY